MHLVATLRSPLVVKMKFSRFALAAAFLTVGAEAFAGSAFQPKFAVQVRVVERRVL